MFFLQCVPLASMRGGQKKDYFLKEVFLATPSCLVDRRRYGRPPLRVTVALNCVPNKFKLTKPNFM